MDISTNNEKVLKYITLLTKLAWGMVIVMAIRLLVITPFPAVNGEILLLYLLSILLVIVTAVLLFSPVRFQLDTSPLLNRFGLFTILALGGVLRLYWVIKLPTVPAADFLEYHKIALGFSEGIFQNVYSRPLGYPALLAATYLINPDPVMGRLLNVLLGTMTIYFVYRLGKQASGHGAGLLAAFIMAVFPTEIFMSGTLNTEIGAAAAFAGSIWLLLDGISKGAVKWRIALAGFLFGIGLLFRIALIFHLPWILAVLGWIPGVSLKWKQRLQSMALFLAAAGMVQVILLTWHSLASGHFSWTPFENRVGNYMLLSGTNWETRGQFSFEDAEMYGAWPEDTRNQQVIKTAWQRISDNPLAFPILIVAKMSNLFADSRYGTFWAFYPLPEGDPVRLINWKNAMYVLEQSLYVLILLTGWIYVLKLERPISPLLLVSLLATIFTALPHVLLEVQGRYHHALVPLICATAGVGGWQLTERTKIQFKGRQIRSDHRKGNDHVS